MSVNGPPLADTPGLTERQKKWFASVRASLERDTGKSLEAWVAIARTCPQTGPRARAQWLKETYGLGVNRAAQIFSAAFPEPDGWDQPDTLREARWSDPSSRAILGALEAATMALPEVVCGQRKQFTSFSRKVQFASLRPVKGGTAMLGLALDPSADLRLEPSKNEPWSERLRARMMLKNPEAVDSSIVALLNQAWARS